jgi:hypothetical protein
MIGLKRRSNRRSDGRSDGRRKIDEKTISDMMIDDSFKDEKMSYFIIYDTANCLYI